MQLAIYEISTAKALPPYVVVFSPPKDSLVRLFTSLLALHRTAVRETIQLLKLHPSDTNSRSSIQTDSTA